MVNDVFAKAWSGFKGDSWKRKLSVTDFVQDNYTPYEGNNSFLSGPTDRTKRVTKLFYDTRDKYEKEGFLYDNQPSSISGIDPGYISEEDDIIFGLQTLLSVGDSSSLITETVFENRFMNVNELKRMGADIKIEGKSALVTGVNQLQGASVKATDLRAGASLILAGLIANGDTEITDIHHIDRGYVDIESKIRDLGGKISRIEG